MSLSSSYPVYPAHEKLWLGSGEGRNATAHTHRGEYDRRVPRLEKGLQRGRNLQLPRSLQVTTHVNYE